MMFSLPMSCYQHIYQLRFPLTSASPPSEPPHHTSATAPPRTTPMRPHTPLSRERAAATEDLVAAGAAVPEPAVLAAEEREALEVVAVPDGDEAPKAVVPLALVLAFPV